LKLINHRKQQIHSGQEAVYSLNRAAGMTDEQRPMLMMSTMSSAAGCMSCQKKHHVAQGCNDKPISSVALNTIDISVFVVAAVSS